MNIPSLNGWLPLAIGLVSALVCLLVVATQGLHGRLTLDGAAGVQKFHTRPTPRVGGLGVFLALALAAWAAPGEAGHWMRVMLLAGLPAFLAGFAEDLFKRVGVRERLLATMLSGVLAWGLCGVSLTRLDVIGLDFLLGWLPLSVAFTAFAVAGVANAVNIIDGFNGLAGGVVLICLAALGAMAQLAGDAPLATVCLLTGAAVAGFLIVNYPSGRIFLGDGGAYLVGFGLGWLAVLLPMRNPTVSPWAAFLACSYPIIEVLFSVVRRHRRKLNPGHPDRLHLHSLIKCRVIRKVLPDWSRLAQNSAVAPLIWVFAGVPAAVAVVFREDLPSLVVLVLAVTALYAAIYRHLVGFRMRLPYRISTSRRQAQPTVGLGVAAQAVAISADASTTDATVGNAPPRSTPMLSSQTEPDTALDRS